MIPIKDDNPTTTIPIVTIFIICINIVVFINQLLMGSSAEVFIYRFAVIPWEIIHFRDLPNLPPLYHSTIPNILTLFTSMFIHGGFLHLAGNMLYLWIFGDNVESIMGHFRFLIFYFICGLVATLCHVFIEPNSSLPLVGASGAISGVLGAYFVRFPRARVHVLIIFFFFIRIIRVSALFVLGLWFVIQVLNGFSSIGVQGGGVAWFAHIGGFVSGLILVFFFEREERLRGGLNGWWW